MKLFNKVRVPLSKGNHREKVCPCSGIVPWTEDS